MSYIKQLKCSSGYIEIIETGRQGSKGDPGVLPDLGTTGQVLTKLSDESGDAGWISPTFTGNASNINALDPFGNPSDVQTELDRRDLSPIVENVTITNDAFIDGNADINGTLMQYIKRNDKVGDEGIGILGELHVGTHDDPKESVFGGGDSHTDDMIVLTTKDSVVFTDVTAIAKEPIGEFDAFDGVTTVGAAMYIKSARPHLGLKILADQASNTGGARAVREYWNGSAWTEFFTCVSNADYPYQQRGDTIATVAGAEQVRFTDIETTQVERSVNGEFGFWIRLRITVPFPTNVYLNQIKLHTSRYEINKDGNTEYFGRAVYKRDLPIQWNLTQSLVGYIPSNESIIFANGLELVYIGNEFTAAATDGRGGFIVIPEGLDTSKPLELQFLWVPLSTGLGDVVWEVISHQAEVGDLLGSANIPASTTGIGHITIPSQNMLKQTIVTMPIHQLVPGELLSFGFKRLGQSPIDTYPGSVAMINVRVVGRFWKP